MQRFAILLIALILVGTACSKPDAATEQPTQPGTPPSGTETPAPAPNTGNTPAAPPANNADPAKPDATAPAPAAPAPVQAPKGAAEQPVATKKQYDAVDFGMTFEEVQKQMGQMGKLVAETKEEDGSNATQTYQYKTSAGGTLNVTFKNGKVLNKSESSK
ncbi:hypothetical protein [Paenibacillus xerothermodurans]|uniref:DUF3862 domain-containing protein n=1 Tax=Paenibacillus xerothermodurans TaxID=1977292 RepID=A0A2W1NXL4_PAEXE|nr:hypothetical protein [Paenibacillus xerothermodurans]PZE20352.1 hypothetical protein CBW46_012985 [Paenibacillus xerothermodurans]